MTRGILATITADPGRTPHAPLTALSTPPPSLRN